MRSTAPTGSAQRDPSPNQKLASRIADRIVRDIVRDGWPLGQVIGSEIELLDRYDVSRAVFREAIRLLEHLGVATTRRGPGGGLIVTAPSTSGVIQAFIVYLTFADVSLDEMFEARISIERSVARLAAERADEEQIQVLRDRVHTDRERQQLDARSHHVLHDIVAHAARNPAAELFTAVLGRLTARWSYPSVGADRRRRTLEASAHAHDRIVDAIIAGDSALAERRMGAHLSALGDWLALNRQTPRSVEWVLDEPDAPNGDVKLGERVARSVIVDIVNRGWPIGEVIGGEAELIERHDVSRAAMREAIRLLEYHQVATMKRGPGGGLAVAEPSIEPIVRAATVFLEYRGITASDLIAIRRDLEADAVALLAQRATPADVDRLREVLATDLHAGFESPLDEELHATVADLAGNRAIALFVRVLVHLTREHASVPGRRTKRRVAVNEETDSAHRAIVDAVAQGDAALSRRRLTKHLAAMEPLLR